MTSCPKCGGKGSTVLEEVYSFGNGHEGRSSSTLPCECRLSLPPRDGKAQWWGLEQVHAQEILIPIFNEHVQITVDAEVPMSEDGYRLHRRGNRYYPTLVNMETPASLTLHSFTARELGKALIAAADAADRIDDADTDPRCGHWAPCDCEGQTVGVEGR